MRAILEASCADPIAVETVGDAQRLVVPPLVNEPGERRNQAVVLSVEPLERLLGLRAAKRGRKFLALSN